jgi:hypothetical protein
VHTTLEQPSYAHSQNIGKTNNINVLMSQKDKFSFAVIKRLTWLYNIPTLLNAVCI